MPILGDTLTTEHDLCWQPETARSLVVVLYVLMVARYFTPQHGLKGWSERGGTSGLAHITKGSWERPCSITIAFLYIKD